LIINLSIKIFVFCSKMGVFGSKSELMETGIGNRIRKIRKLKGYTQDFMAAKMNISQRAYSKIENNNIKLDWNRIVLISKLLEVDPMSLVNFDDNLIFNNCSQSGKFEIFNNHFPLELKESYEQRIEELKNEIAFLRNLLSKTS